MNTVINPGCVVLLVDESAGMKTVMGDMVADGKISSKTNAERVATAVNALLGQLVAGPAFDIALIGYRTNSAGEVEVGPRWSGTLAGREFVSTAELAAAPLKQETRTRRVPLACGGFREEPVNFPVWYEPDLGAKAPQIAAYQFCCELLSRWDSGPAPGQPLVFHVFSGASGDGNPQLAVAQLLELNTAGGPPLVIQAHLAASSSLASTLYPANAAYLPAGAVRELFRRASVLPDALATALREVKLVVHKGARGMIYNAKVGDLIRGLGLVKAFTKSWPSKGQELWAAPAAMAPEPTGASALLPDLPPPAATPASLGVPGAGDLAGACAGERIGLAVFLLDRAVEDPFSGNLDGSCARLQDQANDLIKQLGKLPDSAIDVALVSYGTDSSGLSEVRDTFDGPLAGRCYVRNSEITEGALRVDEYEEEVSNGIGGLVKLTRKKPIYFDLEPMSCAQPWDGFGAAGRIIAAWAAEHPAACMPPIVLHLTSGRGDLASLASAAASVQSLSVPAGPVIIYQLALTATPCKSLSYPASDAEVQGSELAPLWDAASPLLDGGKIAAERPSVLPGARGIVVNGKFDLLVDTFQRRLAPDQQLAEV